MSQVEGILRAIQERLGRSGRLQLFLDYDGTLAEFAPTPDDILPDPRLIALLERLAGLPRLRIAVISGRRLAHIQALLPVEGILLAGTYGIELQTPDGERIERVDAGLSRGAIEALKARWQALLAGRQGFYLEDKGWSLALHARDANEAEAERVLGQAHAMLVQEKMRDSRILGGQRFLEIGPRLAHKGATVEFLLECSQKEDARGKSPPLPPLVPVHAGDDDKDEEAFAVVHRHGGLAIRVARQGLSAADTQADFLLASPAEVRLWLERLGEALESS